MPTKHPHKKSRHGCRRCRERRVKCDEKLPRCSACVQRQDECCYSYCTMISTPDGSHSDSVTSPAEHNMGHTPTQNTGTTTESTLSHSASDSTLDGIVESTNRFRELELMHYWCVTTCNSFTEEVGDALRDHIVREALRHVYLMEAVLALTSLHIASGTEDIKAADKHVISALHYQHRAVVGLRSTLDTLSPANCDAVFISSMIIMVCTIVSPLLQRKRNQQTQSTAEAMLKLTDFLNGIQSILDVSRKWISEGPLSCILDTGLRLTTTSLCFPREGMRHLNNAQNSDPIRLVFDHAIDALEQAARRGRSVVPWITAVKPEFLEALRDGNSLALAIFMQWGVLLDQFDGMWWAKFSGRRLVDEISVTLGSRGDEWMHITGWCRTQVGLCQ